MRVSSALAVPPAFARHQHRLPALRQFRAGPNLVDRCHQRLRQLTGPPHQVCRALGRIFGACQFATRLLHVEVGLGHRPHRVILRCLQIGAPRPQNLADR